MSEERVLATRDTGDVFTLAKALFESGYFNDVRSASQAVVKVLYGREIGLSPVASMRSIYISKSGTPTVHAEVLSAAIRNSRRYEYKIVEHSSDVCELAFFERDGDDWRELGRSRFTMADAKAAGITDKDVWQKYPRNLLFARAMSNGKRWYCPDVASGFYTTEELDAGPALPEIQVIEPTIEKATGEIVVVSADGPNAAPTWTTDAAELGRWWALCNRKGLSNAEVHQALGVQHMREYHGTKKQAVALLEAFLDAQMAPGNNDGDLFAETPLPEAVNA